MREWAVGVATAQSRPAAIFVVSMDSDLKLVCHANTSYI